MSRTFRITLLIIETLWLGVLVPGHTRGQISAMGDGQRTCCSSETRRDVPVKAPPKTCAICYIVATLDVPPAVIFIPPPTGWRLDDAPIAPAGLVFSDFAHRPDLARAPPVRFASFC